jgi:hypothetical protein
MTVRPGGDAERSRDIERVSRELRDRLDALGIRLDGRESADELVRLEDAVEEFESAVQSRGGDLMVDEGVRGKATEPDDRHFALPLRREHETVSEFLERLARATDAVRRHPMA